jgi:hypothetical protein
MIFLTIMWIGIVLNGSAEGAAKNTLASKRSCSSSSGDVVAGISIIFPD